uniref:NmrA-like domain-containing protein n=1 Tax=Kwoniella dejecticola CBS 10117 TaxID=1296121 RepID=A0A1A5ZWX2_9TREE|nr:uncharacterized protein I303_07061 [Kwoniella dejecticola CBS 10117]OBR82302.1 hypothetical protein I303_07061 [Kwoniella dejecticola CBS 10117]
MDKIDNLLGPLNPNKMAAKTSPDPLKVIVFTATGDQGRSVCKDLIADGGFVVWGVTRNVDKLTDIGVKMVQGDLGDKGSYVAHLQGMDGAFINSDYNSIVPTVNGDTKAATAKEYELVKALVDACKEAGVGHIVYSALDGFDDESKQVPYFQSKAQGEPHGAHHNVHWTNIYPCTYFSNIYKFSYLTYNKEKGCWVLGWPLPDDTLIPSYAVEQTGIWVKKAFLDHKIWRGKDMQVCSDMITPLQMAEHLSQLSGRKVVTLGLTKEVFHSEEFKKQLWKPLWLQYRSHVDGYFKRDVEQSKKVCPEQWSFKQWASQDKELKKMFDLK